MRFTVSAEQIKFFQTEGYLALENLLTKEEAASLLAAISSIKSKSPGYPEENLFRSIPMIATVARKRRWGEIAFSLIQKKPLRIAYDKFFSSKPTFLNTLDEYGCGLILNLNEYSGLFFKNHFPSNLSSNRYLLLILTSNHLPEQINPVIFR